MPGKKSLLLPAIGAAVVVVGGAAFLYFKGTGGGVADAPMASAKIVPDEAVMASFISTDSDAWEQLEKFGTPEAQKLIGQNLKDFQQKLLTENQVDYEKDVKPWVGSVMIAMLPPSNVKPVQQTTPAQATPPNTLLVVGIKDKNSALQFANKMKSQAGVKSVESDYKGVQISEFSGKGSPTYTAVVNDHLVIAPQKHLVEQAIETSKGQPSFASKPEASTVLEKKIDLKNQIASIYLPDYASAVQQLAASNPNASPIPPQTLAQLKQIKSVVAGVGVDDLGLRLKAVANLDPKAPTLEYKTTSGKVVSQFPTETFALISGGNLNQYWTQISNQAKTDPNTDAAFNQFRQQMKVATNIDVDQEIFGWMDGEFALGTVSVDQGLFAQLGFGGVFVFDTSDRKTAESTLAKLDDLAKRNYLSVGQRDVQGKKITEWQAPQGQGTILGHGWLDDDSVFVAMGPLVEVMANKPAQTLDSSATFKDATNSLAKPNLGYFYLDMEKTMAVVNRLQPQSSMPPETAAVLNSIRGLGASAQWSNKTTNEIDILLALKPAK
jgi:hypothetical protein